MDSLFHQFCKNPDIVRIKKNGGLRFYVDYRKLKKITMKNSHLFPIINKILDRFNGFKSFIKLD